MGWPNNYVQGVYNSDNELVGVDDGAGGVQTFNIAKAIGQSTAVALAMEELSAAMPKNNRYTEPKVTEQGVIELGPYAYQLEKTLTIDLSGATSRFGLTIKGQGSETTKFIASETSTPANFKGVDNIWRMINIKASASEKLNNFRLSNLGAFCYFTQGGDGSTIITDDVKVLDFKYLPMSFFDNLKVYGRNFTALSKNQYLYYFANNYYSKAHNLIAQIFTRSTGSQAGVATNNTAKPRSCGVGYGFSNNNAFQGYGLTALSTDTAYYLNNENGLSIIGGDHEFVNRHAVFDAGSRANSIRGIRVESHYLDAQFALEDRGNSCLILASETSRGNTVELLGGHNTRQAIYDYSDDQSNRVYAKTAVFTPRKTAPIILGSPATVGTITSVTTSADVPHNYDDTTSVELQLAGEYNYGRNYPFSVDPKCGSVSVVMAIKRVSGDGMMTPNIEIAASSPTADGLRLSNVLDANARWRKSFGGSYTIVVSSGSYAAGETTLNCTKPHLLQAGMRVQLTGVGSLGAATNAYVKSVISPTSIKVGTADPGAITGGTIGLPVDMMDWLDQPDVTEDWLWLAASVRVRQNATNLSLNGSNHPVITSQILSGVTTGHVLKFSGFADPELNVEYTVQSGDVTGSTITCSLLTLPGMSVSSTGHDTTTPTYGYVGIKNLRVNMRCVTTSGTPIVWRFTQPIVYQGYNDTIDY